MQPQSVLPCVRSVCIALRNDIIECPLNAQHHWIHARNLRAGGSGGFQVCIGTLSPRARVLPCVRSVCAALRNDIIECAASLDPCAKSARGGEGCVS